MSDLRNNFQEEIYVESYEIVIFVVKGSLIGNFTSFCLLLGVNVALDVGDKEKGTVEPSLVPLFWLELAGGYKGH